MSDFTSFITEPFYPKGPYEAVSDWFRLSACWVEVVSENGSVAFADIISNDDEGTAWDHARWTIEQLDKLLPEDADLRITGLDHAMDEYEPLVISVSGHRSDVKWQAELDARRAAIEAKAKARVERYGDAVQNPQLDDFLKKDEFLSRLFGKDAMSAPGIDEYLWP